MSLKGGLLLLSLCLRILRFRRHTLLPESLLKLGVHLIDGHVFVGEVGLVGSGLARRLFPFATGGH